MTAEILAVGTELLLGDIANTNAQFISRELAKLGINVYGHTVVGDNAARLKEAFARAFEKADLIIATGGLGPTADDLTKETAAEYFGLKLVLHRESWAAIQGYFKRRVSSHGAAAEYMPANNRKQAMLPEGCIVFPNGNGTAPGVCIEQNGKTLILLPGPPGEMEPMFTGQAAPFLREKSGACFISRTLRITGVGESRVEEILDGLMAEQTNPTLALYAKTAEVHLRITASAPDERQARALIDPVAAAAYGLLGGHIYGEDGETLESAVVKRLIEQKLTLAVAESCTGGLLTGTLVNVPDVSNALLEGFVTYSNAAKINRLNVSADIISAYGAVSAETAAAMAENAAKLSGAAIGLSVTGIAGPGGGTPEKPVGLVYLGLYMEGKGVSTKELRLTGDRFKIRSRAVVNALDMLRLSLL